jgi:hypothetical protein
MPVDPSPQLLGDPDELIVHTFGGDTFKASRRTHAHLWETQRLLGIFRAGAFIRVIQPPYNSSVPASAGTHDKDGCLDIEIVGWDDWYDESEFLRACGWADWVRNPLQGFGWHHHMISRGTPENRLGDLVPAQLDDFNRHALGLKGQHNSGSDPQCFDRFGKLKHSIAPIFNYADWRKDYVMTEEDFQRIATMIDNKLDAAVNRIADAVMMENVDTIETGPDKGKKVTAKAALRQTSRGHREVL